MTKEETALRFLMSHRGNLIMGQALVIAIKQLNSVPPPHKEESNIADMEYLLDELFPIGKVIEEAKTLYQRENNA